MPLSEHEQKMLEQMERALYAEDPKFASQMKGRNSGGPPRKRLLTGLAVAFIGMVLIVGGVTISQIWLGGVGFAAMVAGVAWAFSGPRATEGTAPTAARGRRTGSSKPKQPKKQQSGGSFMQRMENRWDDRKRGQEG